MSVPFGLGSRRLDHLGLVAGMYDELGVGELFDELIVQDHERRTVSVGQAVKAMVLNGLGFTNRTLYLAAHFFRNRPTERLIGPGIEPEHLHDDTLGRALDELYAHDVTLLFSLISAQAVERLGLKGGIGHLDATCFHLHGAYRGDEEAQEDGGVVEITHGYSRDHRPDLVQVGLNLIVEHRARLPLWMQPVDGNCNDKQGFGEVIEQHVGQLQARHGIDYWVADSALYSADNLRRLSAQPVKWITRVPETLKLAVEKLDALVGVQGQTLAPGYRGRSVEVEYAGVRQRWLVVTSVAALQRGVKSVDRQLLKDSQSEFNVWQKLTRRRFACQTDAQQELEQLQRQLKVLALEAPQVVAVRQHAQAGRPAPGVEPQVVGYELQGHPYLDPNLRLLRLMRKAAFIIATNELDEKVLSNERLLLVYKGQQNVERGFRFLKDPMFQASNFYLKSPQRIMALLMVMTLCLLVYAALEYRLRQRLEQSKEQFPDQKGKLIDRPTMRWVFQYFQGIDLLLLPGQPDTVVNRDGHHILVLQLLGSSYEQLYS